MWMYKYGSKDFEDCGPPTHKLELAYNAHIVSVIVGVFFVKRACLSCGVSKEIVILSSFCVPFSTSFCLNDSDGERVCGLYASAVSKGYLWYSICARRAKALKV